MRSIQAIPDLKIRASRPHFYRLANNSKINWFSNNYSKQLTTFSMSVVPSTPTEFRDKYFLSNFIKIKNKSCKSF